MESRPETPSAAPPSRRGPVLRWAAVAAATALLGGIAFDVWYTEHLLEEARVSVSRAMGPTASALRTAMERRVALIEGLRSFAEAQPTRARLDAEFPTFAQGLGGSAVGVRALQFVEDGIIVSSWPLVGNERALGYNLLADPRPEIPNDVRRALATDDFIVTGPIQLVQGGEGLLVRRRLALRPGFPQLSAIILDVGPIVREVGIPNPRLGLYLEVHDRRGSWFGGDPPGMAVAPESLSIPVPDGDWTLLGAPMRGWNAMIAPQRNASRAATFGLGFALVVLASFFGQRQGKMATALADRSARLGIALKAGKMGSWEFDVAADRMTFDDNGAAILGRSVDECSGSLEKMFAILHPEDAAFVARVFLEMLRSDRNDYTLEHRILMPDGTERWVLVLGDIARDIDGKAVHAHGIISDASDRRAIEARARQLERVETIGTMAGGVAHDFNNLLTGIISFTELARDGLDELGDDPAAEAARADLNEALKVAARARTLTAQLLAFSRGASSEPRRTDVSKLLAEMEPLLKRLLGKRIALTMKVEPNTPKVWIDPSQLTQVVLNLVVNARDAIVDRGEVSLRLRTLLASESRPDGAAAGVWVLLEVSDSGVGMPEEVRKRVFEPYFTTKKQAHGTGLGLSVVHGVVRAAGGQAVVESTPGAGTTFWIMLPPMAASGSIKVPSEGTRPDTPSSGLSLVR